LRYSLWNHCNAAPEALQPLVEHRRIRVWKHRPRVAHLATATPGNTEPPKLRKRRKTANPPPEVEERVEEVIQVLHRLHEAEEMQE